MIPLAERPHVVYIAWRGDVPMYVGMTCDLRSRLRSHDRSISAGWTTAYTHIDFTEVPDRATAERLEWATIGHLRPTCNRRLPPRDWSANTERVA